VQETVEQRTSALVQEAAAPVAEKLQSIDVTGGVRAVSRALHCAANSFHEEGYESFASVTDRAAERVSHLGDSVKGKDPKQVLREAQQFAHENPTAFIVGCALVGFAISRFFTTSSREPEPEYYYEEHDTEVDVPVAPAVYGEPLYVPPGGMR
jgi:hypothetical protein